MSKFLSIALAFSILTLGLLWASQETSTAPTTQPKAGDILDKVLQQGPPVIAPKPVSQPKRYTERPDIIGVPDQANSGIVGRKLLPEGHVIADRRGRLIRSDNQWKFVFESDAKTMGDPPILLLPNSWLEKMEADVAASTESIIFRISGEVTAYHGNNYLLLRKVLIERH